MQRAILCLLCLMALTLSACAAKDPVQTILKDYNMSVVSPPRDGMTLGEIFADKYLSSSVVSSNSMDAETIERIMKNNGRKATLTSVSSNKSYDIDANATYIGDTAAMLKILGATSYSVTFRDATIYSLPLDNLMNELLPTTKRESLETALNKNYYVSSLLEVGGMEYTFKDSSGASANLGAELDKVATNLEGGFDNSKEGSLIINEPRFIGYRTKQILITKELEEKNEVLYAEVDGIVSQITRRSATAPIDGTVSLVTRRAATDPADIARGAKVVITRLVVPAGEAAPTRRSPGATVPVTVTRYVIEARDVTPEELKQSR
ncbi:hypothetical protein [Pseudodesulfovibrio pelocollis]|uniref:hypothetical protein n=1 Tax=Pseudodesulfovibrio pelocollis TaxID=3051432 RepID=UPI00255ACC89|nr:hypothetical protein [Pseudodesulfovibrio sp. SB368]